MVLDDYGHAIEINMCIPVTVARCTSCYIILGCFVGIELNRIDLHITKIYTYEKAKYISINNILWEKWPEDKTLGGNLHTLNTIQLQSFMN